MPQVDAKTLHEATVLTEQGLKRVREAAEAAAVTAGKYTYVTNSAGPSCPVYTSDRHGAGVNVSTTNALHGLGDANNPGYFWWGLSRMGLDFMMGGSPKGDGSQVGLIGFVHNQFYGVGPTTARDVDGGTVLGGAYLGGASSYVGPNKTLDGKVKLEVAKSYTLGNFTSASAGVGWIGGGTAVFPDPAPGLRPLSSSGTGM